MRIVTSFSKGIALALAAIFCLSVIIVGCTKNNAALEDSSSMAEKVSSSSEFKHLLTTMSDLQRVINVSREEKELDQTLLLTEAKLVNTKSDLIRFLNTLGFNNASQVADASEAINSATIQVFNRFPQLYKFQKEEVFSIFMQAKTIGKGNAVDALIKVERNDICSDQYASGKEACAEALGWDLFQAGVAGILALGGTPLLSAGTILTLSGVAYLKEGHCNNNVVKAWRACRSAHPL